MILFLLIFLLLPTSALAMEQQPLAIPESNQRLFSTIRNAYEVTRNSDDSDKAFKTIQSILNEPNFDITMVNEDKKSAFYLIIESFRWSRSRHRNLDPHYYPALIDLIIKHPTFDSNIQDSAWWTPSIMATEAGDLETLRKLLQIPTININAQDKEERTALYYAATADSPLRRKPLITLLREHGAQVSNPLFEQIAQHNKIVEERDYDKFEFVDNEIIELLKQDHL